MRAPYVPPLCAAQPSAVFGQNHAFEATRVAVLALLAGDAASGLQDRAVELLGARPSSDIMRALAIDGVDQLLLAAIGHNGLASKLPTALVEELGKHRLRTMMIAVKQEHTLHEVSAVLDQLGLEHVVLKGALVRTFLYEKVYLRPCVDVDLLVAPNDVPMLVRALESRGYSTNIAPHSDTHEIGIERNGVVIDLHWSLLRPGRMRREITHEILAKRVRRGDLWSPNNAHLTVAMLVHPAITDHVTGRLISAVDLDRWLRKAEVPWEEVGEILARMGLRTAAWAMLRWTHGLFNTPVPEDVWRALAPSPLRGKYIEAWLARHPAALYQRHPNLVRSAFSLALQDRVADVGRALWKLARKDRLAIDRPD